MVVSLMIIMFDVQSFIEIIDCILMVAHVLVNQASLHVNDLIFVQFNLDLTVALERLVEHVLFVIHTSQVESR
jgi:hypothetical protein